MTWFTSLSAGLQWTITGGFFLLGFLIIRIVSGVLRNQYVKANWRKGEIFLRRKDELPPGIVAFSAEKLDSLLELLVDSIRDVTELSISKLMQAKMDYVVERLSSIENALTKEAHKLLQEKGVGKSQVSQHSDFTLIQEIIRNIIYTDNGVRSMKSVIRHQIKHKVYADTSNTTYLAPLVETLFNNASNYVTNHYQNTTITGKQYLLKREITREELFDIFEKVKPVIRYELENMFTFARKQDSDFRQAEDQLLNDQKSRIKRLILEVPND